MEKTRKSGLEDDEPSSSTIVDRENVTARDYWNCYKQLLLYDVENWILARITPEFEKIIDESSKDGSAQNWWEKILFDKHKNNSTWIK